MSIVQALILLMAFVLCSCTTSSSSLISSHKITYLDSDQWVSHKMPRATVSSDLWLINSKTNKKVSSSKTNVLNKRRPSSLKKVGHKEVEVTKDVNDTSELISQIKTITPKKVAELISSGIDPDLQDADGNSALHYAVLSVNLAVAKALIENGASKTIKNNNGETPLDLIKKLKKRK